MDFNRFGRALIAFGTMQMLLGLAFAAGSDPDYAYFGVRQTDIVQSMPVLVIVSSTLVVVGIAFTFAGRRH